MKLRRRHTETTQGKKKEVPTLMLKAVLEGAELAEKLHQLRVQQSVLKSAGLDVEAMRLEGPIGETMKAIDAKVEETMHQRKRLIREMLLCFAVADLATASADIMESTFLDLSFGREANGGASIAKLFRMQAQEWNQLVQMVDGMGHNDKVSFLYADMAEDIVKSILPSIYEKIDKCMSSEEGKRLL